MTPASPAGLPPEGPPGGSRPSSSVGARYPALLVLLLALAAGGLPLLLFWFLVGRAPSASVEEAWRELNSGEGAPLLVDVRSVQAFERSHVQGAQSWPAPAILALRSLEEIPAQFSGHTLLLICDGGISSGMAALRLQSLGVPSAFSVRGGLQSWTAQAAVAAAAGLDVPSAFASEPIQNLDGLSALAIAASLLVIKPAYMLLTMALIGYLAMRGRSLRLPVLGWALVSFLVGEFACWVNLTFIAVESVPLEYIHSVAMVIFIALLAWVGITFLDERVLRYSDPQLRCALLGVCRQCRKNEQVPCLIERMSRWGVASLALVSLMPLPVEPRAISSNAAFFGFTRNLMHPLAIELYETRFIPLFAAAFLLIALLYVTPDSRRRALLFRLFLAGALGAMLFGFFRLAILSFYSTNPVWFLFWEELTELMLVVGIGYALRSTRRVGAGSRVEVSGSG